MSLETLRVKTETEEVCVKEEAEECDGEETGAHVKEEAACEDSAGLCELYADHQIKDELVLGPVEVQRPCVPSTLPAPLDRAGQGRGRACSVRLERLRVDAARRSCRVGRRTYTLRRTREPRDCTDTESAAYQCDECATGFNNKALLRKHVHTHLPGPFRDSTQEDFNNEETGAHVKEEAACEDSAGLCELYADHQIKDELVLGPVEVQRPCVPSTLPAPLDRAGQGRGRACSVRLERLRVDAARRSCRVGRRTYTLRRTREPRDCTDTESATYQCDECTTGFSNNALLRKHVHNHLPGPFSDSTQEDFACDLCDSKFKTKLLVLEHEKKKHGVTSFMSTTGLKSHIVKKLLNCNHCSYSTVNEYNLKHHLMIHNGEKPFKCSHCDYKCRRKAHLERHGRIHTGEKPFKCSHCDYKCSNKSYLQCHEMIHTGEKPFKCSHCDYKCKKKSHLQCHEMIHTGEKPFKCSHCDYTCIRKSNLQIHERTHTGEKPFICSHCGYKCRQKAHLEKHERIHSGEKPYKCSHCDYKCTAKSDLQIHERIHTGKKPFICSHCDYKCRQKAHLERHEKIHTGEKPFKCSHCDYKCATKSDLQVHERIHTGEKPFKCSHCDYKCTVKSSLRSHERIHTGEKPFKCSHCDYAFRQKGHLLSHESRIHTLL